MNNRKIKLALTVGLINSENNRNVLDFIKNLMLGFKEVGAYLGLAMIDNHQLNNSHIKRTYAIRFENCRLDVDLVSNSQTKSQIVQSFQLR